MSRISCLLAMTLCAACSGPRAPTALSPRPASAEEVHRDALVIDLHLDTPQRLLDRNFDLGEPLRDFGQVNLEMLRRGNVGAVFFAGPARQYRRPSPRPSRGRSRIA